MSASHLSTSRSRPPAAPWVDLAEPAFYVVGSSAVRLAAFRQPPQRVAEHVSPEYILCINTGRSTRFEQCVDGVVSGGLSRCGDMSLYPPGTTQSFRWQDPADFLHVYLDPNLIDEIGVELFGAKALPRTPARLDGDRLLVELASSLSRTGALTDPAAAARFERLASALAVHLVDRRLENEVGTPGLSGEERLPGRLRAGSLDRVTRYVERHLHEPVTLETMAALAHLSPSHFSRSFRAATGLPPHRYLVARRVARAEDLLRTSALPIAQVAEMAGFSDQSHLNRHFRRRFGTSPGAYRRARSVRTGGR